jgi:tryptophanyl-tRNA synthetase
MSKSDEDPNGCIMLLDDADTISRKFKRAVTDSGTEIRFNDDRPAINNLLTIYHLVTGTQPEAIEAHFAGKGYAQLKGELADATIAFLEPFQQRLRDIDDDKLNSILARGSEKARVIAAATFKDVRHKIGVIGSRS